MHVVTEKAKAAARGGLTLDNLPESMSIKETATAVRMHHNTVRRAIRSGELQAFMPRGRIGKAGGRQGYRVSRGALQAWYFNDPSFLKDGG